jgi:hypothetical protein
MWLGVQESDRPRSEYSDYIKFYFTGLRPTDIVSTSIWFAIEPTEIVHASRAPGTMALVFVLILAIFALPSNCSEPVNVAAAANTRDADPWTGHVFYQSHDGELYLRSQTRPWSLPQKIPLPMPPKSGTPLTALYYNSDSTTDSVRPIS